MRKIKHYYKCYQNKIHSRPMEIKGEKNLSWMDNWLKIEYPHIED
jgi:hypothetical protein